MERKPLKAAISKNRNWIAYYYYYAASGYIRIFVLDSMKLIAEYKCDPIFVSDLDYYQKSEPFSVSADGNALHLISRGVCYEVVVDAENMDTKIHSYPVEELKNERCDTVNGFSEEKVRHIHEDYYAHMRRWLPDKGSAHRRRADEKERRSVGLRRVLIGAVVTIVKLLLSLSMRSGLLPYHEIEILHGCLQHPDTYFVNGKYWILDPLNGMVSVADSQGNWIAHYQFGMDTFAMSLEKNAGHVMVYATDMDAKEIYGVELVEEKA